MKLVFYLFVNSRQ